MLWMTLITLAVLAASVVGAFAQRHRTSRMAILPVGRRGRGDVVAIRVVVAARSGLEAHRGRDRRRQPGGRGHRTRSAAANDRHLVGRQSDTRPVVNQVRSVALGAGVLIILVIAAAVVLEPLLPYLIGLFFLATILRLLFRN